MNKHKVIGRAALGIAGACLSASLALPAHAATQNSDGAQVHLGSGQLSGQTLSHSDLLKSQAAAASAGARQLITKNIEATSGQGPTAQRQAASGASATATDVASEAVPVYTLNPAFVAKKSSNAANLWYVAYSAQQGAKKATVFTSNQTPDHTWQAVNVASGDTESVMAAKADGGTLFTEPQINGWYAIDGNTVRALNADAVKAIGAKPVSVATYQSYVAKQYGDKLPGSQYDKDGFAGGSAAQAQGAANEASGTSPVAATSSAPDLTAPLVGGAGALVAAGAITWVAVRRRRA